MYVTIVDVNLVDTTDTADVEVCEQVGPAFGELSGSSMPTADRWLTEPRALDPDDPLTPGWEEFRSVRQRFLARLAADSAAYNLSRSPRNPAESQEVRGGRHR